MCSKFSLLFISSIWERGVRCPSERFKNGIWWANKGLWVYRFFLAPFVGRKIDGNVFKIRVTRNIAIDVVIIFGLQRVPGKPTACLLVLASPPSAIVWNIHDGILISVFSRRMFHGPKVGNHIYPPYWKLQSWFYKKNWV